MVLHKRRYSSVIFNDAIDIEILVRDFLVYCEEVRNLAKSTIITRRHHLYSFSLYCSEYNIEISDIDMQVIDGYFLRLNKERTISTVNSARRVLKVFIKWLRDYKEIDIKVHPAAIRFAREPKLLPKAIDRSEILRVLASRMDFRDKLLISVVYEAGLRISEVTKIKCRDVSPTQLLIHGKGDVDRVVYITKELASKLDNFILLQKRQPSDYLFQQYRDGYGQKLSTGVAGRRIVHVFQMNGIAMTPHQLRHSIAVHLLMAGCDIVTVQKQLGHRYITTTQTYLRLTDNQHKNTYEKHMKKLDSA